MNFTNIVLSLLGPIKISEISFVVQASEDLERKGWLPDEVVAKLRWMEHVSPNVPEDVALRRMREVDERVALRFKCNSD